MTIETLGEIRAKYNFWNEKERPYYEALSEAIRVLNAQKDKFHYANIVRCGDCKWYAPLDRRRPFFCPVMDCVTGVMQDDFCSRGERREKMEV